MRKLLVVLAVSSYSTMSLLGCSNTNSNKKEAENSAALNVISSNVAGQQNGIVGEWEQQYTAFDRNGNYKLDPDEKKASGTRLGFDWFRFNADGSCLRDRDIKLKGTYEI